jgi:hypothetical protein
VIFLEFQTLNRLGPSHRREQGCSVEGKERPADLKRAQGPHRLDSFEAALSEKRKIPEDAVRGDLKSLWHSGQGIGPPLDTLDQTTGRCSKDRTSPAGNNLKAWKNPGYVLASLAFGESKKRGGCHQDPQDSDKKPTSCGSVSKKSFISLNRPCNGREGELKKPSGKGRICHSVVKQ